MQPWYILIKEELGLVGLCIPYSLSIHWCRRHVKAMIKQEGTKFGDSQWPKDPQYWMVFMEYYHALCVLSKQLFSILAKSLGNQPDLFDDFLREEVSLARFLPYLLRG